MTDQADQPVPARVTAALRRHLGDCVIAPHDEASVLAHKQHAAKLPFRLPKLLLRCAKKADVVGAVKILSDENLVFSVRGGGHCFSDLSTGAAIVIDLAEMNGVTVDEGGASVGGGSTSAHVASQLAKRGSALPTGGWGAVGFAGLCFSGGLGFSTRRLGLLCDHLSSVEMVLADSREISINADEHSKLFRALCGGGAIGYGIAIALRFRTLPLEPGIACEGVWPLSAAPVIGTAWQDWLAEAPINAGIDLFLHVPEETEEPGYVRLHGGIAGAAGGKAAAQLRGHLGPLGNGLKVAAHNGEDFARVLVGELAYDGRTAWKPSFPFERVAFQNTRSQFLSRPISADDFVALVSTMSEKRTGKELRDVELTPLMGGRHCDTTPDSFIHRQSSILARYTTLSGSRCDLEQQTCMSEWPALALRALSHCGLDRSYQGYAEGSRGWLERSYGEKLGELIALKRDYDSRALIHGQASLTATLRT